MFTDLFLKPEVPGFCPSNGFVVTVSIDMVAVMV